MYNLSIFLMSAMNRDNQASYKCLSDGKRRKTSLIGISKVNKYSMNFFQNSKILVDVIPGSIHSDALV